MAAIRITNNDTVTGNLTLELPNGSSDSVKLSII